MSFHDMTVQMNDFGETFIEFEYDAQAHKAFITQADAILRAPGKPTQALPYSPWQMVKMTDDFQDDMIFKVREESAVTAEGW